MEVWKPCLDASMWATHTEGFVPLALYSPERGACSRAAEARELELLCPRRPRKVADDRVSAGTKREAQQTGLADPHRSSGHGDLNSTSARSTQRFPFPCSSLRAPPSPIFEPHSQPRTETMGFRRTVTDPPGTRSKPRSHYPPSPCGAVASSAPKHSRGDTTREGVPGTCWHRQPP